MSKFCVIFLFIGLFIFSAIPATAWDDAGHKLTAYIAWQRMTPEVREKVINILLAAPENSDLSVFYKSDSRSEAARKLELFMVAATWADIVRDRKFDVRYKTYHHGNWHYADTFWKQTGGKVEVLPAPDDGGKAVEKLYEFEKLLRDGAASDADKAIALAWIIHLGGDIHQPLHTSGRVTELEPKGDQGGNLFLLTPQNTPRERSENLHWYWDSIIGENFARKDACDADYLFPIAAKMMKKYSFEKMRNQLELENFNQWQKESFAYNPTDVFTPDLKRYETPSAKYRKHALEVSERQLTLAGYRIGEMFNRIFGAAASSPAAMATAKNCYIIRRVDYPVTPTASADTKKVVGLLNLCPANIGQAARPMYPLMENGAPVMREYDVEKVFKTAVEARRYAAQNNITDVSVN